MKKIFLMLMMFISLVANAQKDVTKFLGIPVDGYKAEMKKKLANKGFTYNARNDCFEGEFNGQNVYVFIATNNNKVWRIMVCDAHDCGEGDIIIRFNNLCRQFSKNKKYFPTNFGEKDYIISDGEDISYEMRINNKRYQASYYHHQQQALRLSYASSIFQRRIQLPLHSQLSIHPLSLNL